MVDSKKYLTLNRRADERSISPFLPLKNKLKYLPVRIFAFPFLFKNEDATNVEVKTGMVLKSNIRISWYKTASDT